MPMSNRLPVLCPTSRAKHARIFAHHALIDPLSVGADSRVDRREHSATRHHVNHFRHPRPSPTSLEPVAFPSRTRICSAPPGTFPTVDNESARLSVRELRQRFFRRQICEEKIIAEKLVQFCSIAFRSPIECPCSGAYVCRGSGLPQA